MPRKWAEKFIFSYCMYGLQYSFISFDANVHFVNSLMFVPKSIYVARFSGIRLCTHLNVYKCARICLIYIFLEHYIIIIINILIDRNA